jgi:hypothetical protein
MKQSPFVFSIVNVFINPKKYIYLPIQKMAIYSKTEKWDIQEMYTTDSVMNVI